MHEVSTNHTPDPPTRMEGRYDIEIGSEQIDLIVSDPYLQTVAALALTADRAAQLGRELL